MAERARAARDITPLAPATSTVGSRPFERLALGLFAVYACVLSALHEPWNAETQSWRLAIDSDGLRELLYNARYEGHPLLFHVLLQFVGQLSRSWWAAAALHVLIACAVAFVVLRYSPFTRLQKSLLIAGYYPAYEYAILVREYGLGLLCAFAACAAWSARRRRPALTVLFLVLLANTSVLGMLLAMAAGAALALDWLWEEHGGAGLRLRTVAAAAGCILIAAAMLWVVRVQVTPPADAAWTGDGAVASGISTWQMGWGMTLLLRSMVPLAMIGEGTVQWNRWLFEPTGRAMLGVEVVLSLLLFATGSLIAARRWASLLFFVASTVGLTLFFILFVQGAARHHGHLAVAWIMAAWLSRSGPATEWPSLLRPLSQRASRWGPRLFAVSLVPMTIAAAEFAVGDALRPFSDARNVADFLIARGLRDAPMIALSRSDAHSVGALMDRPVVFPSEGRSGTFVIWGSPGKIMPTVDQLRMAADTALQRTCAVVYIGTMDYGLPPALRSTMPIIYETPRRPLSRDRFRVWLRTAPPSPRCPASPG
jgi:hypothetical protein